MVRLTESSRTSMVTGRDQTGPQLNLANSIYGRKSFLMSESFKSGVVPRDPLTSLHVAHVHGWEMRLRMDMSAEAGADAKSFV